MLLANEANPVRLVDKEAVLLPLADPAPGPARKEKAFLFLESVDAGVGEAAVLAVPLVRHAGALEIPA